MSKFVVSIIVILSLGFLSVTNYAQNSQLSANSTKDGYYGPINANDDLWQVAKQFQPNNATIERTAVAIYELNRNAFLYHNINGLMIGYFLQLPSANKIDQVSEQHAVNTIRQQNAKWSSIMAKINQQNQTQSSLETSPTATPLKEQTTTANPMDQVSSTDQIIQTTQPAQETNQTTKPKVLILIDKTNPDIPATDLETTESIEAVESMDTAEPAESFNPTDTSDNTENANTDANNNDLIITTENQSTIADNTEYNENPSQDIDQFNQYLMDNNDPEQDQSLLNKLKNQHHWIALLLISLLIIMILWLCLRLIKQQRQNRQTRAASQLCPDKLKEFSGDSLYDTQLDLATAYIALRRYDDAMPLIEAVIASGDPEHVAHAENLLQAIKTNHSDPNDHEQ